MKIAKYVGTFTAPTTRVKFPRGLCRRLLRPGSFLLFSFGPSFPLIMVTSPHQKLSLNFFFFGRERRSLNFFFWKAAAGTKLFAIFGVVRVFLVNFARWRATLNRKTRFNTKVGFRVWGLEGFGG